MSRHERSGWRDERISRRHRLWGKDVPAVDIDLLLTEYDHCEPKALIEYKHENAAPVPANHPNLQVISRLADLAGLPAFVVRYGDDLSWYKVRALNSKAKKLIPKSVTMTEAEYVIFLYHVRARRPPTRSAQPSKTPLQAHKPIVAQ